MADIYVDAATGSDNGTGSSIDPYRTATKAHQVGTGSDTIYARGTSHEHLVLNKAGITLKVWPDYFFILDGQFTLPTGTLAKEGNFPPYGYSTGHVWDGLLDIKADNITVEDVYVTRSQGRSIRVQDCTGVQLRNCSGDNNRHAILGTVRTTNLVMDGGVWSNCINYAPFIRPASVLNFPGAISTRNDVNITIRNLDISHMYGSGIIMLQVATATVENNRVSDLWRPGINLSTVTDATCRNNYVYYPTSGIFTPAYGGIVVYPEEPFGDNQSHYIYNNIIVNAKAGFMSLADNQRSDDIYFYNNTIINCLEAAVRIKKAELTLFFKNNLIYMSQGVGVDLVRTPESVTASQNLWYGVTPPASWQGTGDIYGQNPLLQQPNGDIGTDNPRTRYYIVNGSSPAINAGTATIDAGVSAPTTDHRGANRSTTDIGAHEYDGTIDEIINCDGNVLANQAFTSGTTGWTADTDGTFEVVGSEGHLTGLNAANLNQLYQESITLAAGATYGVEFDARGAATGQSLRVDVLQDNTPFTNLGLSRTFNLNTTTTRFSADFIANAAETDARMRFVLPFDDGDVFIDNVCFYLGIPAPEPGPIGGGANVVVDVAANTSGADTNAVELTGANLTTTPKAALVVSTIAGETARLSVGAVANATRSISLRSRDANAETSSFGHASQSDIIQLMKNGSQNYDHNASAALITGGLRINKTVTPDTAASVMTLLFGGEDVRAEVGTVTTANNIGGTVTVNLPFSPSVIFFLANLADPEAEGSNAGIHYQLGITTADDNQYNLFFSEFSGQAAGDPRARLSDDRIMHYVQNSQYHTVSFGNNQFTVTTNGATGSKVVSYLALRLESAAVSLSTIQTATTIGTQAYATGFEPQAALALWTQLTALNTTTTNAKAGNIGIGFLSDAAERCMAIAVEDGAATTDTSSHDASSFLSLPDDNGAASLAGAGTLTATGVDIDYTAVEGITRYGLLLAVEYVEPLKSRQKMRHIRQGARLGTRLGF